MKILWVLNNVGWFVIGATAAVIYREHQLNVKGH